MVQATTRVDSLSIELCEDPWLSAIMGHGVFQVRSVEPPVAGSDKAASDILGQVQGHAAQQAAAMYYARVDAAQVNEWEQEESLPVLYEGRVPAAGLRRLQGRDYLEEALHQPGQAF